MRERGGERERERGRLILSLTVARGNTRFYYPGFTEASKMYKTHFCIDVPSRQIQSAKRGAESSSLSLSLCPYVSAQIKK